MTENKKPVMNKELLEKVAQKILDEPRRLRMGRWLEKLDDLYKNDREYPPCGTVGCIAGWAVQIHMEENKSPLDVEDYQNYPDFENEGQKILGLTYQQRRGLFFQENWPFEFRYNWENIQNFDDRYVERAKLAAARIRHMIETGE